MVAHYQGGEHQGGIGTDPRSAERYTAVTSQREFDTEEGMRRRDLLRVLGTVAIALPTVTRAQQADRLRRVGVVMAYTEKDPNGQVQVAGFRQQLQKLGWTEGKNIQIDFR